MTKADPSRLDAETGAPKALADALQLARRGPDADALKRMSSALGVAVPLAPPAVPPVTELATAAASGASSSLVGVVTLVGAVGVGAALVTFAVPRESSVPPPSRAVPMSTVTVEAKAPAPPSTAELPSIEEPRPALPAPSLRRRRVEAEGAPVEVSEPPIAAPPPVAAPADAASRLREEALLVRNAERLLGTEPGRALALTEERRRRFPSGALDQEAEVVAIDALLRLGRRDAANARARSFEARHPGSVHARRIRALLGTNP